MRISRTHPQTYLDLESLWTEHFAFFGAPPPPPQMLTKNENTVETGELGTAVSSMTLGQPPKPSQDFLIYK